MPSTLDQLIAETLKIPGEHVTPELGFQTIPEWDSLAHVRLMAALEERLRIAIDEELMVELTCVAAIRNFVASGNAAP